MKAGLMEIADIFVVNKADRPEADLFVRNLRLMLAPAFATHQQEIPVVKTIATAPHAAAELLEKIQQLLNLHQVNERKSWLLAEKAYYLLQQQRMKDISKRELKQQIDAAMQQLNFNLYRFIQPFIEKKN